MKELDIVQ